MSSGYTLKISKDRAMEMPMVDLAFEVLKSANVPFYYRDLMGEIAKFKGLSEEEVKQVIAQLYTEINIDGRFACVGSNLWGLKRWYPVDKSEDAITSGKRPRIINDEDDEDDLDEDVYIEEEDIFTSEDPDEEAEKEEEEEYDAYEEDLNEFEADEEPVEEGFIEEEELDDSADDAAEDDEEDADDEEPADEEEEAGGKPAPAKKKSSR
ncbi:MAG: DNA-directed polymerase, delta subunit [Paenibacillaceae bacterium]|jgi:DNA-directed RNA polymerase subunit delta|nr:DNA-directed polymerase, delta subunit [Paenibacillaceae bacterium]